MFLRQVEEVLKQIETDDKVSTRQEAIRRLRVLGLDDFGLVFFLAPMRQYPKLSGLLPKMADEKVQMVWTGNTGVALLNQTTPFVRSLSHNFARIAGRSLTGARILDFGCGYGRIARLMYYFSDEDAVYGCDPWSESIDVCRGNGLGDNFRQSQYRGHDLPVGDVSFDLIFAFSVFTHLSERTCIEALNTLRKYIEPNGMLAITIRPVEYWGFASDKLGVAGTEERLREHRECGYAFYPHNRAEVDGDVTYGDTSMTMDWLRAHATGWRVVSTDRSLADGLQVYVFLEPIHAF